MVIEFDNDFFCDLSLEEINSWVNCNKEILVCSAIFTKNNSILSKIIRWFESRRDGKSEFIPSHTGSIICAENEIQIVNIKPPTTSIINLADYLYNTKEEYKIVINNLELPKDLFCAYIVSYMGKVYPFLSAIRSVFSKKDSKYANHCSEAHLRTLQRFGHFKDVNPEITPNELYILLTK